MRIHTGEEPWQCYICDKAFLSQSALENCSKSHSSEKCNLYVLFNLSQIIHNEITHQCIYYFSYLANKKSLEQHMLTHTDEKPCSSLVVVKWYGHICKPSKCINIHNTVIIHRCILNYKDLCQNDYIMIYIRVHTGEKPYQCYICDKDFLFQNVLENDSKLHNNGKFNQYFLFDLIHSIYIEITHQCIYCISCLANKNDLVEHMLIHTEEKPFSSVSVVKYDGHICRPSICMNIYNAVIIHRCIFNYKCLCQNDSFVIYMRAHTGEKPYQ